MLMCIGPVTFEVWPFTATATSRETEATFAEKPVMGRRPPLEFTGEGPETRVITARLLPKKLGGMSSLTLLDQLRSSGAAQYVMRGDGVPQGWMKITQISEKGTWLDASGVPQVIDVEITLKRSDRPNAEGYFASFLGGLGE